MKQSKDESRKRSNVRTSNQLKKFPRDSEEEFTLTREVVPTLIYSMGDPVPSDKTFNTVCVNQTNLS